jgi:hypothetical protein
MEPIGSNAREGIVGKGLPRLRDAHAYGVVLGLVVILFVFADVTSSAQWTSSVIIVLQGITLAVALATSARADVRFGARAIVLAAVVIASIQLAFRDGRAVSSTVALVSAILAVATVITVGYGVRRQNEVNAASVSGAVSIYLLIGMLFVFLYAAVQTIGGNEFFAQGVAGTRALFLYFSYVTMLTLGYGDYTPANQVGKTFAVMEALFGQLYLVTVVAVLVSSFGRRRGPD